MDNYNLDETFKKVLSEIEGEHDGNKVKKESYSEQDCLMLAFLYLLKAYMSKSGETPKTYMVGA